MAPSYGVMFAGVAAMVGGLVDLAINPTPAGYGVAVVGLLLVIDRMRVNGERVRAFRTRGRVQPN